MVTGFIINANTFRRYSQASLRWALHLHAVQPAGVHCRPSRHGTGVDTLSWSSCGHEHFHGRDKGICRDRKLSRKGMFAPFPRGITSAANLRGCQEGPFTGLRRPWQRRATGRHSRICTTNKSVMNGSIFSAVRSSPARPWNVCLPLHEDSHRRHEHLGGQGTCPNLRTSSGTCGGRPRYRKIACQCRCTPSQIGSVTAP